MRNDPFSRSSQGPQRRGLFGNIRWWVLLLAAGYALFYWFSNRTVDPYTGEKVMIDSSLTRARNRAGAAGLPADPVAGTADGPQCTDRARCA